MASRHLGAPVQLAARLDGRRTVLRGGGGGCQLAFHVQPGSYDTDALIGVLKQLRTLLGRQMATLLWDGLPAHRSNQMRAFIASQRDWLVVERLPAYAPDLNPVEGLWANLKDVELANLTVATIGRWSSRPTAGSSGCGRRRTWRTRSCAAPACRSPRPREPVNSTPETRSEGRASLER